MNGTLCSTLPYSKREYEENLFKNRIGFGYHKVKKILIPFILSYLKQNKKKHLKQKQYCIFQFFFFNSNHFSM